MAVVAVGIDIAKKNFEVAVYKDGKSKSYPNTQAGFKLLLQRLEGQQAHLCLEATSRYGEALARALYEAGHTVSIVNPLAIHRYAASKLKRSKTDGVDAKLIAEYVAKEQPRAWTPPRAELAELKELTRRLEGFQEMRQMEKNRLEAGMVSEIVKAYTKKHIAQLEAHIKELKRDIQRHIERHAELKRQRDLLVSIPGIGNHSASILLAEIGELNNFNTAKQLAAYAGVCPRERSSGEWKGKTLMSKLGNARLRKALYMPAVVAMRHNPVVKAFSDELQSKGKHKMVVVGAAMRKLLHLAFGVLKNGTPFSAELAYKKGRVADHASKIRGQPLAIAA